jgi:N utilization substance protein A
MCGKEDFKQGDRVRALVLDVQRESRGPQIVLSRAHPNFVKRLFELEVPEIYEGIIEVKAIARDPGERTKISVYSKDDKVDCVGACVGMRGSRVKNIVNELRGEKIDIVRYSSDIKEYIQASLSPAEISQLQLLSIEKKANIIVADDQLSIAIGRYGQNVRLAGKLVGWELDIFSAKQWEEHLKEESEEVEEVEVVEEVVEEVANEAAGSKEADNTEAVEEVVEEEINEEPADDKEADSGEATEDK